MPLYDTIPPLCFAPSCHGWMLSNLHRRLITHSNISFRPKPLKRADGMNLPDSNSSFYLLLMRSCCTYYRGISRQVYSFSGFRLLTFLCYQPWTKRRTLQELRLTSCASRMAHILPTHIRTLVCARYLTYMCCSSTNF